MDNAPSGQTATRWESAEAAIWTLTTTYADQLCFGLIMFPDEAGANCTQDGAPMSRSVPTARAAIPGVMCFNREA